MKIPWRARLPWFAVWVPVALFLYTLINGAGHVRATYLVLRIPQNTQECVVVFKILHFLYGPWLFLILSVLVVFAYVSWRLCPQWSPSVRWMAGMLGFLLCVPFLLAQAALLCPRGWRAGMPPARELRVGTTQLWKLHFCRPVLDEIDIDNLSPAWKAQASDFAAFLEDTDPDIRRIAVGILGRLAEKAAIPQITRHLEDSDPYVRLYTAWTLVRLGDKSVAPGLVKLLEDPSPGVRQYAALTLGGFGAKSAGPYLAKLLEDSDWVVRGDAAQVLQRLSGQTWPHDTLEASARAWWAQHKDDPEWKGH